MSKQVLFIQGGGDDGYEADKALVASLQTELGKDYTVEYPELQSDESAPDFGWLKLIGAKISAANENVIIVAHSFGASSLLKYLSENTVQKNIAGIFLIATPFWSGDEDWQKAYKLKEDFATHISKDIPLIFYHSRDDEEVPFSHLENYRQKLPHATIQEIERGGHQLNNDLSIVARHIRSL